MTASVLLLTLACAGAKANEVTLTVKGHAITVEVADEPAERSIGLMYRDDLPSDHGMVFVYPDTKERSFWMKDTRVPLTIAYVDSAGIIVHLADMTPLDTSSVPSVKPAMYALEMRQGWFAAHDVAVGDTLTGLPKPSAR
ncbi:MAG: DUF192 domain-containing protein [Pseudomonadota bacterium]|nr:DUF192 domain-containing protein [Pseudomonadota bacterium]